VRQSGDGTGADYYDVIEFDLWLNFKPSYNITPT
jgi:hypothetical protein